MRPSFLRPVLVLAVLTCPLVPPPAPVAALEAPQHEENGPLGPSLARLLAGEASPGEAPGFRLAVGCLTDQGWRSVELYGDGLGFWRERTQIRLSAGRMQELLAAFRAAGFADMPEAFGRSPGGPKTPPIPEEPPEPPRQPARMICSARLEAGGEAQEVRQFDKGEVSEALKSLAHTVLAATREAAAEGVTVESIEEGLRALSDGRLDPRAFRLQVHRRFEGEGRPGLTGWILRLHGQEAEVQRYTASGGLGPGEPHRLDEERLETVVGALREFRVSSLPANLWAAHYTELRVEVLGFEQAVLARRFAGMTLATHGETQERFTRLFNAVHGLVQELEATGSATGAGPER